MDETISNWIPSKRIRFVVLLAMGITAVAVIGSLWSRFALLMLIPAAGAGFAAFVMLRIRRQLSGGWQQRIHDAVADRLPLMPAANAALLDIGCGDASLIATLVARAPSIAATGVDFWGDGWDYAQSVCETRVPAATFRRMDAGALDFPDARFDCVTSVMCFHEVGKPMDAVREALRVLRPGGRFVLVDRFRDAADYGDPAALDAMLAATAELRRERLVETLGIPWPLNSKRSLGPVDILSGRKAR